MFICPNCQTRLKKVATEAGYFWHCPVCDSRAVTLPVLQKAAPQEMTRELWQRAGSGADRGDKACPACGRKMSVVALEKTGRSVELDVCRACYLIWFDPSEFESLPATGPASLAPKEASPVSRMTLARAELQLLKEEQKAASAGDDGPDNWWELIPAAFGLPVEYDKHGISEKPLITWGLSAVMVLLALGTWIDLPSVVEKWGLLPSAPFRHYGLTFITSFFLHAGFLHLSVNLYFLLVFGDNVEEELGGGKYVLLLAASALLGDCFHVLGDPRTTMPLIGASGGISGIIVYYALQFPRTRIGMLIFFRWYRVPVGLMAIFWFLWQILGAVRELAGLSNVSALGHLGGAVAGFLFWLAFSQASSGTERDPAALGYGD